MRHAARKDNTHAEISAEFERLGCTVLDTSRYPEFVDVLVLRHEIRMVEAKSKTGTLRPSQKKLAKDWPIYVVRSRLEAMALVQEWDEEQSVGRKILEDAIDELMDDDGDFDKAMRSLCGIAGRPVREIRRQKSITAMEAVTRAEKRSARK